MEKWRDYPSFEGIYQVSNLSRLRNIKTGNILKPHLHHSNYYTIAFKKPDEKPKYLSRARVIAITWIPNPENKKEVNHKNGVTTDDRICNLEWVTPSENILHYYYKLNKGIKRRIVQMSMEGVKIREWDSMSLALQSIGRGRESAGNLTSCCKGRVHYAYGFKWSYVKG